MGRSLKLRAIVLRTVDYGERDRVVALLSRERGKLSAFARGARTSRRRFGGALEPFHLVSAEVGERPGAELWTLREVTVECAFAGIRADLARIACAGYAIELARELVRDAEPHEELFDLVAGYLARLDAGPARPWDLRGFELGALRPAPMSKTGSWFCSANSVTGATASEPPPAPLDLWAEWRRLEDAIHGAWDEVRGQGIEGQLHIETRAALGPFSGESRARPRDPRIEEDPLARPDARQLGLAFRIDHTRLR